ncbi:MAG: hydroxymyristoyl-ACP dehydratase [Burkholderiales bacterium]
MTKADIAALVPHQGPMCLLSEVMQYDERSILCRATSHRSASNPLRRDGRLPALAGIEYGAQALAAHCSLVGVDGDVRASHGVLAGVRALTLHVDRLDDINEALEVRAERLIVDGRRLLYGFAIAAGDCELVNGRVAVVLQEDK